MRQHVCAFGLHAAGEFDEMARGDAFPEVIEARPARDAVEIRMNFDAGKGEELFPVEAHLLIDESRQRESPAGGVEVGRAEGIQHWPFDGLGLAGRDAIGAAGIGGDDDVVHCYYDAEKMARGCERDLHFPGACA